MPGSGPDLETVGKQNLHSLRVRGVHDLHPIELPEHAWSLLSPVMALHALGVHDLAGRRDLEATLCTLMGLKLGFLVGHLLAVPLVSRRHPTWTGLVPYALSSFGPPYAEFVRPSHVHEAALEADRANHVRVPDG